MIVPQVKNPLAKAKLAIVTKLEAKAYHIAKTKPYSPACREWISKLIAATDEYFFALHPEYRKSQTHTFNEKKYTDD